VDVVFDQVERDWELVGNVGVGEVFEEELNNGGAAGGGELVAGFGEGGFEAEFLGEGAGGFDVFLFADAADVVVDGVDGEAEVFGDLGVGPVVGEAGEDLAHDGGGAIELADAGAMAVGGEGGGFLDFAAEKQAGGEEGDEVVPEAGFDGADAENIVAALAGEGGRRGVGEEIGFGELELNDRIGEGGVCVEGIEDAADGEGMVEDAAAFFAGGAEPVIASEAKVIVDAMRGNLRMTGKSGSPTGDRSEDGSPEDGLLEVVGDGV